MDESERRAKTRDLQQHGLVKGKLAYWFEVARGWDRDADTAATLTGFGAERARRRVARKRTAAYQRLDDAILRAWNQLDHSAANFESQAAQAGVLIAERFSTSHDFDELDKAIVGVVAAAWRGDWELPIAASIVGRGFADAAALNPPTSDINNGDLAAMAGTIKPAIHAVLSQGGDREHGLLVTLAESLVVRRAEAVDDTAAAAIASLESQAVDALSNDASMSTLTGDDIAHRWNRGVSAWMLARPLDKTRNA